MATKIFELQKSIFERLNNDEILKKMNCNGIFDYVPEDFDPPYICLGQIVSNSDDTKTDVNEKVIFYIEIWSEEKGKKNTLELMIRIEELLEEFLTLETGNIIKQKIKSREVIEQDYKLFHGSLEIEFYIEWI